jgi:hypothetical protein
MPVPPPVIHAMRFVGLFMMTSYLSGCRACDANDRLEDGTTKENRDGYVLTLDQTVVDQSPSERFNV